ncbi:MAG: DUF2752 domain-containing protein [Lachnospiraceae bacterium]
MKRSISQIIKDAWKLFCLDIWQNKVALFVIIVYFTFIQCVCYSSCPMVMVTGYPCPACGMTRAGVALLRGDFALAWKIHPFIYGVIGFILLFITIRYILRKKIGILKIPFLVFIVAMIAYYFFRMVTTFPSIPPMSYYNSNLLAQLYYFIRR